MLSTEEAATCTKKVLVTASLDVAPLSMAAVASVVAGVASGSAWFGAARAVTAHGMMHGMVHGMVHGMMHGMMQGRIYGVWDDAACVAPCGIFSPLKQMCWT